jgi:hypothetical protein
VRGLLKLGISLDGIIKFSKKTLAKMPIALMGTRSKFWDSFCQPKRQKWSLKSHHGVLKMVVSMAAVHSPQWAHIPNIDAITPVIMPCDIHLC